VESDGGGLPVALTHQELPGTKVVASLDYGTDTLTITRSAKDKVSFQARYRILAFQAPFEPVGKTFFSWQPYKRRTTNVIGTLITNGATVKLDFKGDNTYQLGRILVQPRQGGQQVTQQARSKSVIYLLFALVTAGAVILARSIQHKTETSRNVK
jgi:hypothetical protein